MDRAGFEPAAFRFSFAWMRTGRSLAPKQIRAYQAELPALECHKTHTNLNRLSNPLISLKIVAHPETDLATECQTRWAVETYFVRSGSAYCAYSAVVSVGIAAFGASSDHTQESLTSISVGHSCEVTTLDVFLGRVLVMQPSAVQPVFSRP